MMPNAGDLVSFVGLDGAVRTERVESATYTSPEPEIRKRPTGLRRIARSLTPRRWRKPLPIVRPYKPAEVTLSAEVDQDAFARHHRQLSNVAAAFEKLTR